MLGGVRVYAGDASRFNRDICGLDRMGWVLVGLLLASHGAAFMLGLTIGRQMRNGNGPPDPPQGERMGRAAL